MYPNMAQINNTTRPAKSKPLQDQVDNKIKKFLLLQYNNEKTEKMASSFRGKTGRSLRG